MIGATELKKIARARIQDAEALLKARRYDGGTYICGYAVELALKAKICRTLKWVGFPESNSEFQHLQSFKTHQLEVLLRLSGQEEKIKTNHFAEWSTVSTWDPSSRYRAIGSAVRSDLVAMIDSAKKLVKAL